jgi:hypothetical protein
METRSCPLSCRLTAVAAVGWRLRVCILLIHPSKVLLRCALRCHQDELEMARCNKQLLTPSLQVSKGQKARAGVCVAVGTA